MGYGALPESKRTIFPSLICSSHRHYKNGTIDVAALFRKLVPYNLDAKTSVYDAVRNIFLPGVNKRFSFDVLVLCFDSPSLIPEVRRIFYEKRRYKKTASPPKKGQRRCEADGRNYNENEYEISNRLTLKATHTSFSLPFTFECLPPFRFLPRFLTSIFPKRYPVGKEEIGQLTPMKMPCGWAKFWNSASGKYALWECIEETIIDLVLCKRAFQGTRIIMDRQNTKRWVYPAAYTELMPMLNYGEGDMKCIHWGNFLEGEVLVMTIDWDVPLALLLFKKEIDVWISTVWIESRLKDPVPFTASIAKHTKYKASAEWKKPEKAPEVIHMESVIGNNNLIDRQQKLLVSLCAGGIDYCLGLSRFGFSETKLVPLACMEFRDCAFLEKVDGEKSLLFWPSDFLRFLKSAWVPGKCKEQSAQELSDEIQSMLWCVQYFSGFNIERNPGGPVPPTPIKMFDDTKSVQCVMERAITEQHDYVPVFIDESPQKIQ